MADKQRVVMISTEDLEAIEELVGTVEDMWRIKNHPGFNLLMASGAMQTAIDVAVKVRDQLGMGDDCHPSLYVETCNAVCLLHSSTCRKEHAHEGRHIHAIHDHSGHTWPGGLTPN